MKTFLGFPDPKTLKPSHLWGCVALNQLAFPGLGSVIAGRRSGYAQAAIFVVGFVLVMGFLLWFLFCAIRFLKNPAADEGTFRAEYRPYAWAWQYGLALCVAAWIWSLFTSLGILRQARRRPCPGAPSSPHDARA